jgi:hypothetical protein
MEATVSEGYTRGGHHKRSLQRKGGKKADPILLKNFGDDADCLECITRNARDESVTFEVCDFENENQRIELKFASSNAVWFQIQLKTEDGKRCLSSNDNCGGSPIFVDCPDDKDIEFPQTLWSDEGPYLWSYECLVVNNDAYAVLESDSCSSLYIDEWSESSSEDFTFLFIEDFVGQGTASLSSADTTSTAVASSNEAVGNETTVP